MLPSLLANWPLKLLALTLAFGIWVSVTGENRVVQDFTVPLEIALPDNTTLAVTPPTTVTVRLRGPETSLRRLEPVRLGVRVDLSAGPVGNREVQLSRGNLTNVPEIIDLEFINPDRLALVIEELLQRSLPVEAVFVGEPPAGYAFYGAAVEPSEILIEGPASEVNDLVELRTNPVRLDLLTEPVSLPAEIVPDSPRVRAIDGQEIEIRVFVDAKPIERQFDAVAVVVEGAIYITELDPGELSVTLTGPPTLLDTISAESLRVVVSATDLQPRSKPHKVEPRLEILGITAADRERITVESLSQTTVDLKVLEEGPGA